MEERKVIKMSKEFFKNLPDTSTPLNASRLNGLLNGNEAMGNIVVGDVRCKNLFNINALTLQAGSIDYTTGTITVNQYANGSHQNLKALAPDLVAGETYTLSLKTTSDNPFIYLEGSDSVWMSGNSRVLTQAEIDDTIIVYGEYQSTATVVISEIQIEEGTTATEYTPYKAFGIESGSNENGSWVKFEDGTMIQYGIVEKTGNIATQSSGTKWFYDDGYFVHLPQNFINNLYFANVTYTGLELITLQVYSITDYATEFFKFNLSSNIAKEFSNYKFRWFAIGRWK